MNTTTKTAGIAAMALAGYDALVRPWIINWGASRGEQHMPLPGDDIASGVPAHYTKAVTIQAPPEAVWPWLAQIGDHRAGFYSDDWVERFVFPGTVHYIEGTHSATRIHPELQQLHVGDPINTASVGTKFAVGNPVTVLEPGRALVIGTWAFVLRPLPDDRTRLLVRDRDWGYLRAAAPRRLALLRAALRAVDYLIGEPLHFAMERKMMLGLKQRAESAATQPGPATSTAEDGRHPPAAGTLPDPAAAPISIPPANRTQNAQP
jgi:hypothetical protein